MKKRFPFALLILLPALVLTAAGCSRRPGESPPAEESALTSEPAPTPEPTSEPTPCPHEAWEDGVCAACGTVCSHPSHDAETRQCSVCGKAVPHKYSERACVLCGAELAFRTTEIPAEEYAPCPEPGTVETVSYIAPNYRQAGMEHAVREREKPMTVYLPYGYDPSEQYDVLILLHGAGCDENYYLNQSHKCWGKNICGRDIIDNMIYTGVCGKMIVACPTIFYNDDLGQHRFYNVSAGGYYYDNELRNDILPYLAEHYSTFAADGTQESLRAARAHFGFCGFSMGSVVGYMSVLSEYSDLFGWIGCLGSFASSSVYGTTVYAINSALSREEFADCPIYFLYNGGGESDPAWQEQEPLCRMLIDASDKLDENNTALIGGSKATHEGKSWILGMYNCLHVFFSLPDSPDPAAEPAEIPATP